MKIYLNCKHRTIKISPLEAEKAENRDLHKISLWAQTWKVTFNPGKTKDLIFSNKNLNNSPPLIFNNNFIERVNTHRHLGVYLTSNLDWTTQVNDVCLKANRKLSVLRNVKYSKRNTLDLLYKITVRSVIDYALPIYSNNLKLTDLARLDRLQYRAGKLVTGALHLTSRDKLNVELGWENFQTRINFLGLSLFQKIHKYQTRPLIRRCMSELDYSKKYLTRSRGGYSPYPNYGVKFKNSFFPYMSNLWNRLNVSTQLLELTEFKQELKKELKPVKYRHFSKGSKVGNCLLTRLRLERSDLNLHKFNIGQIDSPECSCHAKYESSLHYLIDCFLNVTLSNLVESYIPNFKTMCKNKKYEVLLMGIDPENPEFVHTDTILSIAVQKFIFETKRFPH